MRTGRTVSAWGRRKQRPIYATPATLAPRGTQEATPGDGQAVSALGKAAPLSSTRFGIFDKFSRKKTKTKTTIRHNQNNFCKNKTCHLLKKFQRNLNIQQSKAQSKVLRRLAFLSSGNSFKLWRQIPGPVCAVRSRACRPAWP